MNIDYTKYRVTCLILKIKMFKWGNYILMMAVAWQKNRQSKEKRVYKFIIVFNFRKQQWQWLSIKYSHSYSNSDFNGN